MKVHILSDGNCLDGKRCHYQLNNLQNYEFNEIILPKDAIVCCNTNIFTSIKHTNKYSSFKTS